MDLTAVLGLAGATWWALASVAHIGSAASGFIHPWLSRRRATRRDQPPVSIIIPVRQLVADAEAAFSSAFDQDYPDFEVLVAANEERSPVLELARQVAKRFPQIESRILNGIKQFTLNPKVSNLAAAIAVSRHDLILVKDSNVILRTDQLAELVQNLIPKVGLVCAIPIGVAPNGFAAEIESAILNAHLAPLMFGSSLMKLNVGFGKVMLFERENFFRAGGIPAIADTFGDDHALAKALARIGLRSVFAADVVSQTLASRSLREVCDRQLRWMVIRRSESPLVYILEPLFYCGSATASGALGAATLGWPAWLAAVSTIGLWLTTDSLFVLFKGWDWNWRFPLASLCREIVLPVLWINSWFLKNVRWAGLSIELPHRIR